MLKLYVDITYRTFNIEIQAALHILLQRQNIHLPEKVCVQTQYKLLTGKKSTL